MDRIALRLGKFPFLNCVPIYYALETGKVKCETRFKIVSGTPAETNTLLNKGEIELGIISSVVYVDMVEKCLILPQLSISSYGKVKSVILFSRIPITALDGQRVMLTPHSATSISLLKLIFSKYFGIQPKYLVGEMWQPNGDVMASLVIGDRALRLQAEKIYPYQLDLGEVWYNLTRLPFVFGLFAVRKTLWEEYKQGVKDIWQALLASKRWGLNHLKTLARCYSQLSLVDYWQHLNYDLTPLHLKSLELFFHYLKEAKEIKTIPLFSIIET